jgi:repressor LexA
MHLAKNLKFLRLKHGFSQDYIANKLGYKSYTTIQKWEMGTSEPSISTLQVYLIKLI